MDILFSYFPDAEENEELGPFQSLLDKLQENHHQYLARLTHLDASLNSLATTHTQLTHVLEQLSSTLPPQLHTLCGAQSDYLSSMIETSLVKLSLLRARTQQALYGSPQAHEVTVASAIGAAHRKLKKDEARIRDEELALDQKLAEYEDLLAVVDGSQSAFHQVVRDWTSVKKETQECHKDLRRLGWTGD